jgi:hypothetical protein
MRHIIDRLPSTESKVAHLLTRRAAVTGLAGGFAALTMGRAGMAAPSHGHLSKLETEPDQWKIWVDPGDAPPDAVWYDAPALVEDGSHPALKIAINGGTRPYTHIHAYRTLEALPAATRFTLKMDWKFSDTTWNNEGAASTIQMIEPAMNTWTGSERYEWALQWQNVADGSDQDGDAPAWRIWNENSWQATGFSQRLEPNRWHRLQLDGSLAPSMVQYERMISDDVEIALPISVPATPAVEPARSAVTMQLGGNYQEDPYHCLIRRVSISWER